MLWLSQYLNFSPVLRTLQDRFGATELETGHFLALQAALVIGAFRDCCSRTLIRRGLAVNVCLHSVFCVFSQYPLSTRTMI
jgi:hypothetical protein